MNTRAAGVMRDFLFVGCEAGHDWQSIGGANAGCHPLCSCSVPVNRCSRCGDSDYGDNPEAAATRADCEAQWGDPATRYCVEPELQKGPE